MENLIHKLKKLGFKEYESKVFLAILKNTSLSASEIADKAKIRRTAVYEILKSFAEKGYCNAIETNSILKYEIINPNIIFDKIQEEIKHKKENELTNLKDTFSDLYPLYQSDTEKDETNINIELIRGFNKHRTAKFIELLKQAKNEILFMVRFEMFVSKELDADAKKFIDNEGVIKSIYEASLNFRIIDRNENISIATMEGFIDLCEYYEKNGEQLRISQLELPNITIFDREIVFINIDNKDIPRHNRADIIIRNPDFAKRMMDLFNYYWSQGYTTKDFKKVHKNLNIKEVISK
jgi:sugar-specific transcriptional regulator TrmB